MSAPVQDFNPDTAEVVWAATPRQEAFLQSDDFEVLYGGAAGGGKGLPLSFPVLTPFGWRKAGDLKPGDKLCAVDGSVQTILRVTKRGAQPVHRFHWHDGTHTDCDEDHLWLGWWAGKRAKKAGAGTFGEDAAAIWTAADIIARMGKDNARRFAIPLITAPVAFNVAGTLAGRGRFIKRSLPPYVLGVLLGDGSICNEAVTFSKPDRAIYDEVMGEMAAAGRTCDLIIYDKDGRCPSYRFPVASGVRADLQDLGLMGCKSPEKFIPRIYLLATPEERWALLQGLMDTDGWADADDGDCYFTSTSQRLADDVTELARSLGALVTRTTKAPMFTTSQGEKKAGLPAYCLRIKMRDAARMFRLPRKRDAAKSTDPQSMAKFLDRVEYLGQIETVCYVVSHPSRLYIADGYVVTHNSDALLIDALCLQHGGLDNRNHRAILFRRSFPELRDLIGRSLELYPAIDPGATYNQTEKIWTFSSGAKVEFGYLHNDADRFKYRGRAWNYIGFDELTLWPTDVCYLYLFSRCRSTDTTLPRYIRSTTNPDGPGQLWVMRRWGIQEDGKATRIPVDIEDPELRTITTIHRTFIPARLTDNKHLSGTGYREALLQLDPESREALLLGLWRQGKIRGAYYAEAMQKMRAQGRIRHVPYVPGIPVNTFWDLGWNDTTAIWFHQFVAGEHRFLRAYENSGEALDHYAQILTTSGYALTGTHYLPHDAVNKSLQTGRSHIEILQTLLPGLRFEVVPRVQEVLTGINATRLAMSGPVYLDATLCAEGIVALDNYRKKYNEKLDAFTEEPLHDRYSNFADAFRQFGQVFAPEPATPKRRDIPRKSRPNGLTA